MEIFKLFGSILIDNEKADKSIAKTESKAEKLANSFSKGIKTAAKWGAAIGAGAIAGGAAMLAMANKTAETTDRIDKLSQRLGMSRQGFQEWEFILSQSGISIDSMQSGMKTLSTRMNEMAEGTGKGAELFGKLNVQVTDAEGNFRNQEEVFNDTITALQGMEDGVEKAAIAQRLFGRSGQELLPLLNGTADSVDEMREKAQELGLVIGDEAVDAGVKFTDSMDQIKRMVSSVGTKVGAELMPIIQKFLEWVISNMPVIQATFKTVFDVISFLVTNVFNIFSNSILPIFKIFFNWIQSNMPTIKSVFNTVFQAIFDIVKKVWSIFSDQLLPILRTLWGWIEPYMPLIASTVELAFNAVIDVANGLVWAFDKVVGAVKSVINWIDKFNRKKVDSKDFGVTGGGISGARENGGPVNANETYLVGEKGPELYTPSRSGTIIPNNQLAGIGGVNINIQNMNIREENDINRVARELYTLQLNASRGVGVT